MDSTEHVPAERLELEIAKARLRLAAERAEPTRLIREGVQASPFAAVATASVAGAVLAALRGKGRSGSFGSRLVQLLGPIVAGIAAGSRERP
ncbi:MAG TPA: hypothetical protein VFD39_01540 [Trueperaceae bacterium]|nr:hypothetical protein [Trueperaceae bacterium]